MVQPVIVSWIVQFTVVHILAESIAKATKFELGSLGWELYGI